MRKILIVGVVALAGCSSAQNAALQNALATFQAWQTTIVADANKNVAAAAQAGLPVLCPLVSSLDSELGVAAMVSTQVQAVKAQADAVATAFTSSPACTNPSSITNVATAVAAGVQAAKAVQGALKSDPAVVPAS